MYDKLKTEEYANVGGINTKSSVYNSGEKEVLRLENFDFQTPGAWTVRPGITNALVGSTVAFSGRPNHLFQLTNVAGALQFNTLIASDNDLFSYDHTAAALTPLLAAGVTHVKASQMYSAIFNNYGYLSSNSYANLYKIRRDSLGLTIALFGLPQYTKASSLGITAITPLGGLMTGTYNYIIGYKDQFFGNYPLTSFYGPADVGYNRSGFFNNKLQVVCAGNLQVLIYGLTTALGDSDFAPSHYIFYRDRSDYYVNLLFPSGVTLVRTPYGLNDFVARGSRAIGASPAGFFDGYALDQTADDVDFIAPVDMKTFIPGVDNFGFPAPMEIYDERLWIIERGIIWFSEKDNPQHVLVDSFLALSTERAPLVGAKAFNQSLIVMAETGIWRISGEGPDYNLNQLSHQYGSVSNAAILSYENKLWFLDKGMIVEFNGATFRIVSNRVEDILRTVNYNMAAQNAQALHVKTRNEVWFAVPTGEDKTLDTLLVYDYLVDSWTTFKGWPASMLANVITGVNSFGFNKPEQFIGLQGGSLAIVGESLTSDLGSGITCVVRTKFHSEMGFSVEKQFRRLFLNQGPNENSNITVNLYENYSTSLASATYSISRASFQGRIDFGISAKALSAEFVHSSMLSKFQIFGYTIESRFQRKV